MEETETLAEISREVDMFDKDFIEECINLLQTPKQESSQKKQFETTSEIKETTQPKTKPTGNLTHRKIGGTISLIKQYNQNTARNDKKEMGSGPKLAGTKSVLSPESGPLFKSSSKLIDKSSEAKPTSGNTKTL